MKVVLLADKTSLQPGFDGESYISRLYRIFESGFENVYVQCPLEDVELINKFIPQENILSEPVSKGTAPAIGLAATYFMKDNPDDPIIWIFANQNVKYQDKLVNTLKIAREMYDHLGKMILIGVAITGNTNDYGYIKIGKAVQEISSLIAFEMISFQRNMRKEEMNEVSNSWRYLWDTGSMISSPKHVLSIFKTTLPDLYRILMKIMKLPRSESNSNKLNKLYSQVAGISMAKGIYELITPSSVAIVPVDLGTYRRSITW